MIKQLLFLEDDTALGQVTTRNFSRKGIEVLYYSSLESLRHDLDQLTFSHALLDLKIGNETSLQLISEIKAHCDVPIVMLTGYGTIRTAVQAMKLGAINFLSKPCTIEEIIAALEEAVEKPGEALGAKALSKPSLKSIEWEVIQKALDDNGGNLSAAARQLKMHRRTLQRKLEKKHLEPMSDDSETSSK